MEVIEKSKCCGCEACILICPVKCIKPTEDKAGFLYPYIDESKCINCGKCRKHCPVVKIEETGTCG